MTRAEYAAYLRSPHWRDVKRRYRASKLPKKCKVCGEAMYDLHHRTYKRLGNERLADLVPLCRTHHQGLHDNHKAHGGERGGHRSLWHTGRKYVQKERKRARKRQPA